MNRDIEMGVHPPPNPDVDLDADPNMDQNVDPIAAPVEDKPIGKLKPPTTKKPRPFGSSTMGSTRIAPVYVHGAHSEYSGSTIHGSTGTLKEICDCFDGDDKWKNIGYVCCFFLIIVGVIAIIVLAKS